MADAAAPRSPLGPAEQCANRAHDLPRGVKVNGKGYLARLWVPGRDWVNLKTWPTKEAAVAARERALERVQVEGYDWLPPKRPTKPRASGAVCTSPAPARPYTTHMSLTSSATQVRVALVSKLRQQERRRFRVGRRPLGRRGSNTCSAWQLWKGGQRLRRRRRRHG